MVNRILFGLFFVLFLSHPCYSQWGSYESAIGGDVILSVPTGELSNAAGTGYGINAKYIYMFGSNLGLLGEAGYLTWGEKTWSSYGNERKFNASSFLLNAGFKLNFISDEVGPYIFALAGIRFLSGDFSLKVSAAPFPGTISWSDSRTENKFSASGGFGYEFDLDADLFLDTSINYTYLGNYEFPNSPLGPSSDNFSFIGINLGLNFGLF